MIRSLNCLKNVSAARRSPTDSLPEDAGAGIAGKVLLPLLPCEVLLLALLWGKFAGEGGHWQNRVVMTTVGVQLVLAVVLNHWVIAPVLRRFESEYGNAIRAAADELVRDTDGHTNKRVLVSVDIGVLSCAGDGRFEIYDGRGLATPSLIDLKYRRRSSGYNRRL